MRLFYDAGTDVTLMKSLQMVCEEMLKRHYAIDGHIHLFSHRGLCEDSAAGTRVGFIDIEYDQMENYKDIAALYDRYLPQLKNDIVLASATDIETIKNIYKKHPTQIRGFGELKLYDSFKGEELNYKRISFAREVAKFSSEQIAILPVYIHYELTNPQEIKHLDKLLKDFPTVPVVLCHCGMSRENPEYAFGAVKRLMAEHSNLWTDISWTSAEYFSKNPMLLTQLDQDRVFWGSDFSPRLKAHGYTSASKADILSWRDAISTYIDSDRNIKRLFRI